VLHPTYSPDGTRIAFATDMGPETRFDDLTYGPYRLAIIEVATRQVTLVPGIDGPKSINPQWTAEGDGLFFISNRTGIPNIYRVKLDTGEVWRVTDLFTGVSGITDVSPALTVARNGSRLLFTEYAENGYNIYALTEPRELAGTPLMEVEMAEAPDLSEVTAALLPPVPRPEELPFNRVTRMLADPTNGLPTRAQVAEFEIVPYRPRLGLDYLGQPQVGVAVGGGAFSSGGMYGGIFGLFSDILARHQVFAALQAQGQLDEIGFALQYVNMRERWNFGGAAQRIPSVFGFYYEQPLPEEALYARQIYRRRVFDASIQGYAQYPFSSVRRAEFSGGLRRISTDDQIYEELYDLQSGQFRGTRRRSIDGISLNLFEASAALVYDNALIGWTSPFAGQRYRFSVTPTFGELQYVQGLGDYRKYMYVRPFTLAVRGLHIGRYGRDAEATVDGQNIFDALYLGQPWFVRGYSSVWNDCSEQGEVTDCDLLAQLFGSRIGVASAELRFPLIRQLVVGSSFGFPPIEGFVFGDAGITWTKDTSPTFFRGVPEDPAERGLMTSAGVGARMNVFGILVLEVDYVKAFAREDKGWQWQFNFIPGF
jgi:hypothetical protein